MYNIFGIYTNIAQISTLNRLTEDIGNDYTTQMDVSEALMTDEMNESDTNGAAWMNKFSMLSTDRQSNASLVFDCIFIYINNVAIYIIQCILY